MTGKERSVNAGLFPALNGRDDGDMTVHAHQIKLSPAVLNRMVTSCESQGGSLAQLVQAAWAIVVQQYAEAERVLMGAGEMGKTRVSGEDFDVLEWSLTPETRVKCLLNSESNKTSYNRTRETAFNTAVLIASDQVTDGGVQWMDVVVNGKQGQGDYDVLVLLEVDCSALFRRLRLVYTRRMLSDSQSSNVATTLCQVMHEMLESPDRRIDELQLFSPQNMDDVQKWNDRPCNERGDDRTIMNVIRQHAMQRPEARAIDAWDGQVSYGELNGLTARLGQRLRDAGVGPGVMVPICFPRSLWAIVAEGAVLQAGGAFVPIDPTHPIGRMRHIVSQTKAHVALTAPLFADQMARLVDQVIVVSSSLRENQADEDMPWPDTDLDSPAYVLFTSGSTGQPKGCVVSHRALANVPAQASALHLRSGSRALQFASYSFGVSLIEIYCVLTAGATICIPSDADRLNRLTETMRAMCISWAYLTTATAGSLRVGEELVELQTLILTGEPLDPKQVRNWAPRVQLCQGFGCTEWAGVCCVSRPIQTPWDRRIIGTSPTANLWLVDPANPNRLAPVGAVAELVIEGPALAQGYLHNPAQTTAAFPQQPDWWETLRPGVPCRVYRTGDLVQYESDGSLRYVTRRDTQVKVRGMRVELGEIEYQIRRTAELDRVVVEAAIPADGHEGPALVAFLHSRTESGSNQSDTKTQDGPLLSTDDRKGFVLLAGRIRQSLCQLLPDYMWPSIYCPLARLPLTVTGKVDRRALRDLVRNKSRAELTEYEAPRREIVPPRTMMEETLHRLFAATLQMDGASFGVLDSFLRLGGDSLLAMKMVNRAHEQHLHHLTVSDVLAHQTIDKIVEFMSRAVHDHSVLKANTTGVASRALSSLAVENSDLMALVPDIAAVKDAFPCSAIQEGILVSQIRRPELYQMHFVWEIATIDSAPLDVNRLEDAWRRVCAHHAMLRTRFYTNATAQHFAVQVVFEEPWTRIFQAQDPVQGPRHLMEQAEAFDGPGLTMNIRSSSHVWAMLQISHAMVDAASTAILMRDLARFYDNSNPEVGVPCEYRDYVSYVMQINHDESLQFWKSHLVGLEPCLFPKLQETDRLNRLEEVPVELEDIAGCRSFCQQHAVTLATLAKLAWGLVLRAFTGSEDVCFGYMTAGRDVPLSGVDKAVGPFINMLVCRIDFTRSASLQQALQDVQADLIESWRHQQVPLTQVQHELGLNSQQLFNTSMTFPPVQSTDGSQPTSITVTEIDRRDPTEYDIMVEMGWDGKDKHGTIKYWSSLLSSEQAIALAEAFGLAIAQIVSQPLSPLPHVDLFSPSDIRRVRDWNRLEPEDCESCVHERIMAVSSRNPKAVAVDSWDGQWTYSELDAAASGLARELQCRGIGPEVFVAICMVKCRWTPVAILATIQAGGAFALLDPGHPVDRLRGMCDQLQAALVLTTPDQTVVGEQLGPDVLIIGEDTLDIHGNQSKPQTAVTSRNALYAVFTSGSTGRPKGVVVEHHSFCASMTATIKATKLTSSDRMFQFASYAFDNSVFDHLVSLLAGACLCIPRAEDCHNMLAATMAACNTTWIIITPSVARLISPEEVPSLQTLCLTGESVGASDLETWSTKVHLFNLYGPAECSIISTVQHYPEGPADPCIIGNALDSVATWVVEPQNPHRLAPVGAIGELVVEGPGVGRGYLHHRAGEPTMLPFLSDPQWLSGFRAGTGRRLYQTGDLVQYTAAGQLRYLGRKDTQVKISGQRVELGEIESAIRSFGAGAYEAVVDVIPRLHGKGMLLACLGYLDVPSGLDPEDSGLIGIADDTFGQHVRQLGKHLHSVLPPFMVPAIFLPLRYIPRSPTGKIDRKALRQALAVLTPDQWETPHANRPSVRTSPEKDLQTLFSQLLQIPHRQIWADSHFFRLGGDSLLAMALVKSSRSVGWYLTMEEIFQYPILSDLAPALRPVRESLNFEIVPPFSLLPNDAARDLQAEACQECQLDPVQIEDMYPCTPIQEGLMALSARETGKYTAQWVYTIPKTTETRRLKHAWQTTVDINPILRTRMVATQKHGVMQVVVQAGDCRLEWKEATNVAHYLQEDSARAMKLGQPLLRFGWVDSEEETGTSHLILTMHHSIYDAVSMELFLDQVDAAYHDSIPTCHTFNHFIKHLITADGNKQKVFWTAEFENLQASAFPTLPLGVTTPRPSATLSRNITIPAEHRELGVTNTTILRAAWAIVVSIYTDSSDVVFGVTVSGRSAAIGDIDEITGPTLATFPLRTHVDPSKSIGSTLYEIQEHSARIIPMEQTGLQYIQRMSSEAQAACAFQSHLLVQHHRQSKREKELLHLQQGFLDYASVSSYALELVCDLNEREGAASTSVAFDPRVLSTGDVTRLLSQFDHVVQQICLNTGREIRHIGLIGAEDLCTLHRWNGEIPAAHATTIPELFLRQVDRWPEKLAVSSWDGDLTYRQLEASSARLVHRLRHLGVTQGAVVPLCFRKSIWPVVAMLAVLRAGGACANIDPKLPLGRVTQMLRRLKPNLILCDAEQRKLIDAMPDAVQIHSVPEMMNGGLAVGTSPPLTSPATSDAAFIVFTSGSTGTPKGIVLDHGNLATCIRHTHRTLRMTAKSRVLQFTAYAFDVSLYDTFAPLVLGATTFIPSEETRVSHLSRYIQLHGIDHAMLIPSAVSVLHPMQVPTLETLVLLGESITRDVVDTWATEVHLVNGYGPAEASVVCAAGVITADNYVLGAVGPMQGTVGWIVDRHDSSRLMPLGATGELLLEGPMVTRGYLDEPDKTREAYIEAPAWLKGFRQGQQPGRLYLTGDLAQWTSDGDLRTAGRKDNQVKLRGQRIELEEVAWHVRQHFGQTSEVAAEIIQRSQGTQDSSLLLGFVHEQSVLSTQSADIVAPASEEFLTKSWAIYHKLKEDLPAYMVPAALLPVFFMPRTQSGKIDRRRLREAGAALTPEQLQGYWHHGHDAKDKQAPVTPSEKTLQLLWSAVLGIATKDIARQDHFFHLGGESITAMKLASMAQRQGHDIMVAQIFDHPYLSDMAALLGSNPAIIPAPAPFELLEGARERLVTAACVQCHLSWEDIDDIYPCTPLQEGMMAVTSRDPAQYVATSRYTIPATLDWDRFVRAWERTSQAHPILRTRIIQDKESGSSYQVVTRTPVCWDRHVVDNEYAASNFSVKPGLGIALCRCSLLLSKDSRPQCCVISMHHALYDEWSNHVLFDEIERAYHEQVLSHQPFSAVVAYQLDVKSAARDFWAHELADYDAPHFPALPSPTYMPAANSTSSISIGLAQETQQITLATQIQLSWGVLVSLYTRKDDVVFGVTTSGRGTPVRGIDRVLGPTIATSPRRMRLDASCNVMDVLRQIQSRYLTLMPYEHWGLQNISRLGSSHMAACEFQSLLVINAVRGEAKERLLQHPQLLSTIGQFTNYALQVTCTVLPDRVEVHASFDDRVIPARQMERVLRQFEHLLFQVHGASSATTIAELDSISQMDQGELNRSNRLQIYPGQHSCMHDCIRHWCRVQPHALAVCAWDAYLQSRGVTAERFVPLFFDKSRLTVLCQLAVLKAGGAFVLLDPANPIRQAQQLCEQLQASLILTSDNRSSTAAQLGLEVVVVDPNLTWCIEGVDGVTMGKNDVWPSSPAYAGYTSGSTGQPKVFVLEHHSVCQALRALSARLPVGPESRLFQFAGYTFDISIMDHFLALFAGACICVPFKDDRENRLAETMVQFQVDYACLTTSVLRTLAPLDVPCVRTMVQIGEAMTQDLVGRWAPACYFVNAYGPAECALACSMYGPLGVDSEAANIGTCTTGALWVVDPDDWKRLLPIGAVGELVVEGPQVGRGYHGDPERTSASFVSDPSWLRRFSDRPSTGVRLYRTGDLAFLAPDGTLRCLGRKDLQVKLRGQRIDLAAVEHHTLQAFPDVSDVVADVISTGDSQSSQLMAFIVQGISEAPGNPNQGQEPQFLPPCPQFAQSVRDTEAHLRLQVPPYMVPTLFIPLARVPLNLNGKANRRLLAFHAAKMTLEQRRAYQGAERSIIPPVTQLQDHVRNIWAAVLNLEPGTISIHDNFFSIGGDSITCMRVASECQAIGVHATAADLWQHKSIEGLASHCVLHPPKSVDEGEWADLSPIQQLFFQQNVEGDNAFSQGFTLRAKEHLEPSAVRQAIHTVVGTHGMLRARFQRFSSDGWRQRVSGDIEQSCNLREWRVEDATAVSQVTAAAQDRLNVHEGPVFVVDLIYVEDNCQQYLSVVAHHLVVDTVSWGIILADLDDSLRGRQIQLPTLSFMDWCSRQADYAKLHLSPDQVLPKGTKKEAESWTHEATIHYWGLNGVPNTLADTVDHTFTLNGQATSTLIDATQTKARTQLPVIIHACLLHAFANVFGDRQVPTVFVEGHGREPWDREIDLTRTVGWFTTLWPAALSVQPDQSLVDVFQKVKDLRQQASSNGWAYFSSIFLHPQGRRQFEKIGSFELTFNHNGVMSSNGQPGTILAHDNTGMATRRQGGPQMERFALLEVNSVVLDGSLLVRFSINRNMNRQDQLERWMQESQRLLTDAATQVQMMEAEYPLSEHPLVTRVTKQRCELAGEIPPGRGCVEDVYPCTPVQRAILLSQLRNPRRYNTQWAIEVAPVRGSRESVDLVRLQTAWLRVVSRHPALRTVLVSFPGAEFVEQVVLKDFEPSVSIIQNTPADVSSLVQDNMVQKPPCPWTPSPRAIITRTVDGQVMITVSISHVFLDETSIQILMRDLRLAYDDTWSLDRNSSFRAFVEHLRAIPADPARIYWAKYLHEVQPCHLLSSNWGPETDPADDGMETISLDLADSTLLHSFCAEHGLLVTNVIHVAWALVLRCYTGMDDVCFSFATSGRDVAVAGVNDCIGLFINHLVARLSVSAESTLLQVLQYNQQALLSSLEHRHASLANLLYLTNIGGRPVFDTGISVRKDLPSRVLPDASLSLEVIDSCTQTEYPVLMDVAIGAERTHLSLVYWISLLPESKATTIAYTFRKALQEILRDPMQTIRSFDAVPQESKDQIMRWNSAPLIEVEDVIHAEVERRVADAPGAMAICAWDESMTYAQLDEQSSRLAAFLIDQGATGRGFIPIYMEKSAWVPVAALATLKAGAAFCLLDVCFPPERLQAMCHQLQASFVLTTARHREQALYLGTPIVVGSSGWAESEPTRRAAHLPAAASPGDPAYVVFTSGSTGTPKAAVVDHRAACASIRGQVLAAARTASSRVLQFSSHAFDVASNDLVASMMTGACLCIPSEDDRLSHLAETARRFQATWITTTPSVARLLSPQEVPTLETVVVGGETPTESDVTRWGSRLVVMYGPAECCMAATIRTPVTLDESTSGIGRGLPSARTWVVDPRNHQRLMPVGVVGELLVEGTSVGRGYHDDPERSRQSFIDPPVWRSQFDLPGTHRFYRTGDLACYLPDGSLQFLGRQDSQVKLRGQRIELSEVEHHVKSAFPQSEVLVEMVTPSTGAQEPFLVAFIGPDHRTRTLGPSSFSTGGPLFTEPAVALMEAIPLALSVIRARLPVFMVPSAFLPLATVPMTAGGKVDRRTIRMQAAQLSNDEIARYGVAALTRRPPSTAAEKRLHSLVAGVLNLSPELLGVDDDLFQRGLDSILAMKLVSAAKQSGIALAVPDIFSHPKISALVGTHETGPPTMVTENEAQSIQPGALLDTANYTEVADKLTAEQPFDSADIEDILPTTTFQRQHLQALYRAYFVFYLPGRLDPCRLETALHSVVRKYSILRTVFLPLDGAVLQVILRDAEMSVSEHTLDDQDFPAAVRRACEGDWLPGPYFTGRYFQAIVSRGSSGRSALILRLSHAQFDRFSVPSLLRDLSSAYSGGVLSVRPTFRDVCAHRRRRHTSSAFSFWEELLRGSSVTVLGTPGIDAPGTATRIDRERRMALSPRPARFTLATIHKAAWSITLARTTGSRDLVFGQVVTGRNTSQAGIEEALGPCANAVPVRVVLPSRSSVEELLERVQSQHLQTMEYDTIDFEDIVQHATSWTRDTYFGSVIQYQNLPLQAKVSFGEYQAAYDVFQFNIPYPCPHLTSTLIDDDTLNVSLSASAAHLDVDHADHLLSVFEEVFGRMLTDLGQEVDRLL
ncbi:uncharacterized protein LDX57_000008 [Aspergillus melleus]|uniref:uncharacterized protein n=1 Tax=Aspergillus melleus TaxID=138277 RepID=UPI001E8D9653|nr:uncharacterized protein LDX57_000008 [Aspergillus melleus]KAH8422250.1 hypothetical protein LDX57_000008 [Aspergillus melleus]